MAKKGRPCETYRTPAEPEPDPHPTWRIVKRPRGAKDWSFSVQRWRAFGGDDPKWIHEMRCATLEEAEDYIAAAKRYVSVEEEVVREYA